MNYQAQVRDDASHLQTMDAGADEITRLGAVQVSGLIRNREISCKEVVAAYLNQIDRLNPAVNAIVARVDSESLMRQAESLDCELSRGHWRGPLHGLPQAPKDVMPVKGMVTTRGSSIYAQNLGASDAIVFERMRSGGAVFVGRTNCPELSLGGNTKNSVYGTTRNAFDPKLSAGGSSGGAAVAVAMRMLPVADGTDMMGSLRTPAAFNHVYGFRPTFGCIPHGPTEDAFFQQFSVAGPMARNIPDLSMLFGVLAGQDARVPLSRNLSPDQNALESHNLGTLRIGWLGNFSGHLPVDPQVLATCGTALENLKTIGCSLDEVTPSFDYSSLWKAWLDLRSFGVAGANMALYQDKQKRKLLMEDACWEIERGMQLTGLQIYEASKVRTAWYQTLRELFNRFDFLVMPAAQVLPFDVDYDWPTRVGGRVMETYHQWLEAAIPATMAGLPALAAPAGLSTTGLPVGIQIIGAPGQDFSVLQLGHAYDKAGRYSTRLSQCLPF